MRKAISESAIDRRVYQREFEALMGCGTTWFAKLEKSGMIPPAKRDPGGVRKWWPYSLVKATVEGTATDSAA